MADHVSGAKAEPVNLDANVDASASLKKSGPFATLRLRNVRFLWSGSFLSYASSWIQGIALNWLAYSLTGSGTILGSINMVRSATALGMIPVTGVLVDRVNHKKLLLLKNFWWFLITLGLGIILLLGPAHTSYLFIFAFLGGLVLTMDLTLGSIVVFDLVPRASTPNTMALLQTGGALTRAFGPALGGFLLLWFRPGGTFLIQAVAYAIILIIFLQMRFPPSKPEAVNNSAFQNIREGIRYAANEPATRTFILMGFILSLFTIPVVTILPPIYAANVFHGGAGLYGILTASLGVGGIFGGVVTAFLSRLERWGIVQVSAIFLLGLSLIAFAFSTILWVAILLLVLSGFFEAIFLNTNQILLQLSIPDKLRGRVTSVVNINVALSILGGLMAGVGSDKFGGPKTITIVLAGIASGLAVIIFLVSSTIRNYRLSQGIISKSPQKLKSV